MDLKPLIALRFDLFLKVGSVHNLCECRKRITPHRNGIRKWYLRFFRKYFACGI